LFLRCATWRSPVVDSLSKHAYTIYLVHYVFVIWLQYALLGAAIPAIVKGLTVFAGALFLSWGIAVGAGRLSLLARPMHLEVLTGLRASKITAGESNRNSKL
jgi:hypothetical protein